MPYNPPLLKHFNRSWRDVPLCVVDFETCGLMPGVDGVVEVGMARFESGACVESYGSFVNPGKPIPAEATAIHGIRDEDVADYPGLDTVMSDPIFLRMLNGAQPAAYNSMFDRSFCPPKFSSMDWPWLDLIPIVRHVDRYERGKGQHKLTAACARHRVELGSAHRAEDDARAAGQLFYLLAEELYKKRGEAVSTLGDLLLWTRLAQAYEWHRFNLYVSNQEALNAVAGVKGEEPEPCPTKASAPNAGAA